MTACNDGTARVWDLATAQPIGPKLVHEAAPRTAAFTPDGSQIVTGTSTGITRFWSVPITPLTESTEHLRLWVEVSAGMELNHESGKVEALSVEEWRHKKTLLAEMGGPPTSP